MNKLLTICGLLLILATVYILNDARQKSLPADNGIVGLVFLEPTVSISSVPQGSVIMERFVFENNGSDVVQLTPGPTSCQCTKAELSQAIVRPGQSGTADVKIDTSEARGVLRSQANILLASGNNSSVQPLVVSINEIDTSLGLSTTRLSFDKVKHGRNAVMESKQVKLRSKSASSSEPVTLMYAPDPALGISCVLPSGGTVENDVVEFDIIIQVDLSKRVFYGSDFTGSFGFQITKDDGAPEEYKLPVEVTLYSPVGYSPRVIQFEYGSTNPRHIQIEITDIEAKDKLLVVDKLSCSQADIIEMTSSENKDRTVDVRVALCPTAKRTRCELTISGSVAGEPFQLSVPIIVL